MNLQRPVLTVLCASVLMVLGGTALAATHGRSATHSNTDSNQLINRYTGFAGSHSNANALIAGLQTGSSVTLETPMSVKNANGTVSTVMVPNTFSPATGKLGYGN